MNEQNKENLEELFGKFLSEQEAKEAAREIAEAEQILRDNPAPEPDEELVAKIKIQTSEVPRRQEEGTLRSLTYKAAAVAALILIVGTVSVRLLKQDQNKITKQTPAAAASIFPAAFWDSSESTEDDADLAILTEEVEQIESELFAMKYDEDSSNGSEELAELEIELMESSNNFWKG